MTAFIQQILSLSRHLLLFLLVVSLWPFLRERPSFSTMPDASVSVRLSRLDVGAPEGWSLHGAWELRSSDVRLAGLSALDCGEGFLDMATDTGSLVTMPFPGPHERRVRARISRVDGLFESEALLSRSGTRVHAQENLGQLLVVSPDGTTRTIAIEHDTFSPNIGVEGLIDYPERETWLALHESGTRAFAVRRGEVERLAVRGDRAFVTGGARHPDGRAFVLHRKLGWSGFSAALSAVTWTGDTLHVGGSVPLPMPFNGNAEGICIEPRGAGSTRLWVVTDDNGLPFMTQRLVAWEVPDNAWPTVPVRTDDD